MRRHMGCTPTEFINEARLRYAKWLLETSSFGTGEISEICGFADLPYFCRKFKDKYEYTPSQFRKNALNAVEKSDINYSYKMKNIKKVKA